MIEGDGLKNKRQTARHDREMRMYGSQLEYNWRKGKAKE